MNGKAKGNVFERSIAKKLSLWLSDNSRDDLLWRTSNSGGRATVRSKKNLTTSNSDGDIASTSPDTQWFSDHIYLELKHYKNLNFLSLLTSPTGQIQGWWKTARSQAGTKHPILIIRQNNQPILWLCPQSLGFRMTLNCQVSPKATFTLDSDEVLYCFLFTEVLNCNSSAFRSSIEADR